MMEDENHKTSEPVDKGSGDHDNSDPASFILCDYCDSKLELTREELAQGWYLCPACDQLSHLPTTGEGALDSVQAPAGHMVSPWDRWESPT